MIPVFRTLITLAVVSIMALTTHSNRCRAEGITPTDKEVLSMARGQAGERWYGIYVLGKKVGWQRDKWNEDGDGNLCNEIQFTLKLAFLGKINSITVREASCYCAKPPYHLVSFDAVRDEDGRLVTIKGIKEDKELVFEVDTGASPRTTRVPEDSDLLSHVLPWAALGRMEKGDFVDSFMFEELKAKKRWQKVTLVSREEKNLMGKKQTIFKVLIEDELGMKLDALITEEGLVLEGSMGPSIRLTLEDKDAARRQDLDFLDLYSTSFIEAAGEIDYAQVSRVKQFKLVLTGESALELAPNRRQQEAKRTDKSVTIEVQACPAGAANKKGPGSEFTRCDADIPCDLKESKELAARAIGKVSDPLGKVLALTNWVHGNFKYTLGSGGGTGDQILKAKKGDCTEYSKALITLSRAAGFPARQLSGIVLASNEPLSFGYHAWVEVWLDGRGWTAVDPTWGHFPVDATHIVFDVDEGLQMASHLGGLSIDILDVKYQKGEGKLTCE